jgi:3-deoxy-7-phosphoheptulonate synthase
MPVGLKNATDGQVQPAIDAAITAASEHTFFGVDSAGRAAAVETTGNPDCHLILRGGATGPNYAPADIEAALAETRGAAQAEPGLAGALTRGLIVDASHGNSGKDHLRQAEVVRELAARLAAGEQGITGLMLESFLVAGAQPPAPLDTLVYGQSVTDKCLSWETTATLLDELAAAVELRRRW